MDKRCPKCRLINPPEAERCDCGWDFVTQSQQRSYMTPRQIRVTASAAAAAAGGLGLLIFLLEVGIKLLKLSHMH